MLEQVMRHVRNYFVQFNRTGSFSIVNGMLEPHDFLLDGQRFYITGSSLSDGVYTYHASYITNDDDNEVVGLPNESFMGIVFALAVPPDFIALAREIGEWVGKFGEVVNSPYQSESVVGVYSYTKSSGGTYSSTGGTTWQSTFKGRLSTYRKVSL